jgi:hypothetical protein
LSSKICWILFSKVETPIAHCLVPRPRESALNCTMATGKCVQAGMDCTGSDSETDADGGLRPREQYVDGALDMVLQVSAASSAAACRRPSTFSPKPLRDRDNLKSEIVGGNAQSRVVPKASRLNCPPRVSGAASAKSGVPSGHGRRRTLPAGLYQRPTSLATSYGLSMPIAATIPRPELTPGCSD